MISAEMGGRITSLKIEEGDYVKKGQIVGKVDVESIKKSIVEMETGLELATTVYERQKNLWDQEIGSEMQYLQAKNSKERIEKSLSTIRTQLSKEAIISPMSGYVDMKFLKSGELTSPGAPIASVINTSTVKAIVDVPENLIRSVRKGDRVVLEFPALEKTKLARINKVGRSINPANRTFKIEINLSNPKSLLKPNLMVLTKINDKTIKNALLLPVELVQQDVAGKSFVYTVAEGEDGPYVQKNIVSTGVSYLGKIVIESGLTSGDKIIDVGARSLVKNDLIEIVNSDKE
jgi:RND family efflux transporter MFP subunit